MSDDLRRRDVAVAVGALLLPIGLLVWFHAAVASEWRDSRSLASQGVGSTAEVLDRESIAGPRSEGQRVTYRFEVMGPDGSATTYTATADVDRATYDALPVGSAVEIRYDADDPARSDIARNDRLALMLFIVVVVDVFLVGAAVAIVRSTRSPLRAS